MVTSFLGCGNGLPGSLAPLTVAGSSFRPRPGGSRVLAKISWPFSLSTKVRNFLAADGAVFVTAAGFSIRMVWSGTM